MSVKASGGRSPFLQGPHVGCIHSCGLRSIENLRAIFSHMDFIFLPALNVENTHSFAPGAVFLSNLSALLCSALLARDACVHSIIHS